MVILVLYFYFSFQDEVQCSQSSTCADLHHPGSHDRAAQLALEPPTSLSTLHSETRLLLLCLIQYFPDNWSCISLHENGFWEDKWICCVVKLLNSNCNRAQEDRHCEHGERDSIKEHVEEKMVSQTLITIFFFKTWKRALLVVFNCDASNINLFIFSIHLITANRWCSIIKRKGWVSYSAMLLLHSFK